MVLVPDSAYGSEHLHYIFSCSGQANAEPAFSPTRCPHLQSKYSGNMFIRITDKHV